MDTVQIEFEPFIDEAARQFIVNGLDMHNIAATALPDYCPVNFVLRGGRGDVLGGVLGLLWEGLAAGHLLVGRRSRTRDRARDTASEQRRGLCALARRRRGDARDLQLPGAAVLRAAWLRGVQRARRISSRARQVLPAKGLCVGPLHKI